MDRSAYAFADVQRMRRLLLTDWELPSEATLDALRIGD